MRAINSFAAFPFSLWSAHIQIIYKRAGGCRCKVQAIDNPLVILVWTTARVVQQIKDQDIGDKSMVGDNDGDGDNYDRWWW